MKKLISIITLTLLLFLTVSFTVKAENIYLNESGTTIDGQIIHINQDSMVVKYTIPIDSLTLNVATGKEDLVKEDCSYLSGGITYDCIDVNTYQDGTYKKLPDLNLEIDLSSYNLNTSQDMNNWKPISSKFQFYHGGGLFGSTLLAELRTILSYSTPFIIYNNGTENPYEWFYNSYISEVRNTTNSLSYSFDVDMVKQTTGFLHYHIYNINFFVTYIRETALESDYTVDYGTDYTSIPNLTSDVNFTSIELIDEITHLYELTYFDDGYYRTFDLIMPEFIYENDFSTTDFVFSTAESSRVIYYYRDNQTIFQLDINNMIYNEFNKFKTVGFITKDDLQTAVMYMFMPKTIDYLMSVNTRYQYRIKDFFTGYSDWEIVEKSYSYLNENNDGFFEVDMTEINPSRLWLLSLPLYFIMDSTDVYNEQTIEKKPYSVLPDDIKQRYMTYFGNNPEELLNYEFYAIQLGQFRTLTSTGFDITDMTIINLVYLKDGQLETVSQEFIDQAIEDYIETNPDFSEIVSYSFDKLGTALSGISKTLSFVLVGAATILILLIVLKILNMVQKKGRHKKYVRK